MQYRKEQSREEIICAEMISSAQRGIVLRTDEYSAQKGIAPRTRGVVLLREE
jgi:hypothetical protein